jgi:succinate-acetate transporter protein
LVAAGALARPPDAFAALGIWYIVLGSLTWVVVAVAWRRNWAVAMTFALAAAGAVCVGIAEFLGLVWLLVPGGWVVTLSAVGAWYTASAMLLRAVYGRWLLPVGRRPWIRRAPGVAPGRGEPGVEQPGRGGR